MIAFIDGHREAHGVEARYYAQANERVMAA